MIDFSIQYSETLGLDYSYLLLRSSLYFDPLIVLYERGKQGVNYGRPFGLGRPVTC